MDEITTPEIPGYDTQRRIGAGASSQVWLVRRRDGVRLAAKLVDGSVDATEQQLLERLDHDHVLRLHDVAVDEASGRTALITDLAEGGSLAACLANRERLTPGELVTVLSPIARALHDLHALGLVHCDLSPENILLTAAGKPLIADLGVSRVAGHDRDLWVTERWAAPEVLSGEPATPAADVHALGAIAWAALVGFAPPAAHERPELAQVAAHAPARLLDLIDDAMAFDPEHRPAAGDFALRLWDCASAEPAPVAGLVSPQAVQQGAPEPAALTRRVIREQRAAETEAEPVQPSLRARLTSAVATIVAMRHGLLPAVGAGGVLALLAVVAWTLTAPAASYAGAATLPHAALSSRLPSHPSAQQSSEAPVRAGITPAGPALSSALAARARAWEVEDPDQLDAAMVPGSAAAQSDGAALRAARTGGLDYRGVRFVVRSVVTQRQAGDRLIVTATVDRPAYRIVSAATSHTVAATSAEVTFTLERDRGRWRISRWLVS